MEEIDLFSEMMDVNLMEYGFKIKYDNVGWKFYDNGDIKIYKSKCFSYLFMIQYKSNYFTFQEVLQYIKSEIEEK